MRDLCRERFEQFDLWAMLKIKAVSLSEMAKRYRTGTLDPRLGIDGCSSRITKKYSLNNTSQYY